MVFVLGSTETLTGAWKGTTEQASKLGVEDPGMTSWPVTSHPAKRYASSDYPLDVSETAAARVIPFDAEMQSGWTSPDRRSFIVQEGEIQGPHVRRNHVEYVKTDFQRFDDGARPSLVHTSFLPVK